MDPRLMTGFHIVAGIVIPSFPAALWSPAVAGWLSSSGLRQAEGNIGRGESFAVILTT